MRIIRISGDLVMVGAVAEDRLWGRGGGRRRAYPPDRQRNPKHEKEKHKILYRQHQKTQDLVSPIL